MQRSFLAANALILTSLVLACTDQTRDQHARGEVYDPYEVQNRKIHEFNKIVDRNLFRPASNTYVRIVPEPIWMSFTFFSQNLSMPGDAVNSLLQGDLETAFYATVRFALNSTVGIAGLSDPASNFHIPPVDTDFGETLHVWGFKEGAMVELPFYGPSTTRDAVGVLTDFFTNPLTFTVTLPLDNIGFYASVLENLADRGNFSDTIDSILYESADSYAQAQTIYLQNRRFELADDDSDAYLDLYDDPYADIYGDPYAE